MDRHNYETSTAPLMCTSPVESNTTVADTGAYIVSAAGTTPCPPHGFQEYRTHSPGSQSQSTTGPAPPGSAPTECCPKQGRGTLESDAVPPSQQPPEQQRQQEDEDEIVVIASPHQQRLNDGARAQSFVVHIIFACIVFWCCNCIFGFIAFILAS